jgi:hypothetical protein
MHGLSSFGESSASLSPSSVLRPDLIGRPLNMNAVLWGGVFIATGRVPKADDPPTAPIFPDRATRVYGPFWRGNRPSNGGK